MFAIVHTTLINAVLATIAVPVVWAIAKLARRPALTHALWLVVLVKLLTPPLWSFHVPFPQVAAQLTEKKPAEKKPSTFSAAMDQTTPGKSITSYESVVQTMEPTVDGPVPETTTPNAAAVSDETHRAAPSINWLAAISTSLAVIWEAGALFCLALALFRVIRFTRALQWAVPASAAIQARADTLARRVGLQQSPRLQFIPGRVCPMLWPIGRSARLLVPQALWDRLDSIQRDTVVLHELAHRARRDHWVRCIELLATSLYWWLPACWLARRQLRRAEEQCCDAWVLWAMPGTFQHYANALLEAVDFVSIRADRPSALIAAPALASGMGQFSDLKGRLTMLKLGNVSRTLSWGGLAMVVGFGALLLPVATTIGQDAPQALPATEAPAPTATHSSQAGPEASTSPSSTPAAEPPQDGSLLPRQTPVDRSVHVKLDQIHVLPAQNSTDEQYIRRLYLDLTGMPPSEQQIREYVQDPSPEKRQLLLDALLPTTRKPSQADALKQAQKRIVELTFELENARRQLAHLNYDKIYGDSSHRATGLPGVQGQTSGGQEPFAADKRDFVGNLEAAPPAGAPQNAGTGARPARSTPIDPNTYAAGTRGAAVSDSNDRLDRLEAQLKMIQQEVEALRAQRQPAGR